MHKLLLAVLTLVSASAMTPWLARAAGRPARQAPAVDLSHLPPDLVVPTALPAGLTDATLLEAWVRLYNATTPVALWPGKTVTGRELAQFLRDAGIPLVWDVQGACRNASCSWQYCAGQTCVFEDGQPGVDPIYIFPPHAAQMPTLVATLAHEAFHRLQPFGPVHDTKFEEYWACTISAAFDPASGFKFDGYDPMVAGYLILWIRDNAVPAYYALPDYPPAVEAALAKAAGQ